MICKHQFSFVGYYSCCKETSISDLVSLQVSLDSNCSFRNKVQTYMPDAFEIWRKPYCEINGVSMSHYRDFTARHKVLHVLPPIMTVYGFSESFFLLSLLYQHYMSGSECGKLHSLAILEHFGDKLLRKGIFFL